MDKVYQAALSAALIKRRTVKEVITLLVKKGFDESDAAEAADHYRKLGYIDHKDYTRRYVADAINIKGKGPLRILRELKERGVEEEIIENALSKATFPLLELMERRFGKITDPDIKQRQKIINHFIYKGFAYDDIKSAFSALFGEDTSFE